MPTSILCISNGHGEDSHTAHVIRALQTADPDVRLAAAPIVGDGHAYRRLGVPIVSPTLTLPSGGFAYMHRGMWFSDVRAGLVGLTYRQVRAVRRAAPRFDAVMATGDHVGQSFAWISGRPFVSFISPLSAMYEGRLRVNGVLRRIVASPRCRAVFTRDKATAHDLAAQGISNVRFGGIPSLDWLVPSGADLGLPARARVVGLLPGSRMPEAARNLGLLLRLSGRIAQMVQPGEVAFVAALVPTLMAALPDVVAGVGWTRSGTLVRDVSDEDRSVAVTCRDDAYADVLHASTIVLGMAGLAVDEAVALGKAVLLVPGEGPQHTYRFAESQHRLLGTSARLVETGGGPVRADRLDDAARTAVAMLHDPAYLARAAAAGRDRLGAQGASARIAAAVLDVAGAVRVAAHAGEGAH